MQRSFYFFSFILVLSGGTLSAQAAQEIPSNAAAGGVAMKIDFSNPADVAQVVEKADGSDVAVAEFTQHSGDRRQGVTAPEKKKVVFVSKTFSIRGGEELLVDADSANPAAYVSIALQDADGKEIPGYGYADSQILVDDAADQVVTWNSHRRLPEGARDVRLQVTLHNATIFAVKTRTVAEPPPAPLAVGLHRQLLADPAVIERLEGGARVELHAPENHGVVLTLDKPWEGNTCAYLTVLQDEGKYRLYYRGWDHGSKKHPVQVCYAESDDGINWKRPILGQVEFDGSTDNNILDVGPNANNRLNFTPFIDTNPDCKPEEKYKAIAGEGGQISAFVSPDGIHWTQTGNRPVITGLFADSQNTAFYDPDTGLYCAYVRSWTQGRGTSGIRGIVRLTSKNFVNWSDPEWMIYPGAAVSHLYTNNIFKYGRAPHLYLGFPCRFVAGQNVEPLFMISRDGLTFKRWDEAVIRPGRNPRQWGNRCNYLWYGMVETAAEWPGKTELSMYSGEEYYRGEAIKVRRWAYRPDGFVSIQAPYAGGSVTTPPLVAGGPNLYVNYSTSAGGYLQVEVLDEHGRRISNSRNMVGDDVDGKVALAAVPVGRPVRLRFHLKDADLFAFRFAE